VYFLWYAMYMQQKYFTDFRTSLKTFAYIWGVGPAVYLLGILVGGEPLDGIAASPVTNTYFEQFLLMVGVYGTLIATVIGFGVSIWLLAARVKFDKRYLLLPVLSIVLPITLFIATFLISGMIIY